MTNNDESATNGPSKRQHIASFIKDIADQRCEKNLAGIAIGVIVDGREVSAVSGWADVESNKPISDTTVFEVGSLSKLFTSLLLAVAAKKQEVRLDDPVQAALGDAGTLPTDGKAEITYRSLANHRSSLPRLPKDLIATADMTNPYVHYDQEMLYACLNNMDSIKPIGSRGEYSNFAVGLLGHVLGKLAGSDYRQALNERVLAPLGMLDTSTEASDEQSTQLATAHKKKNKPTKHWDFTEVTVAAGGVRSSLLDMFKFLRANIDPATTKLADEIMMMREPSDLPECEGSDRWLTASRYVFPFVWLFAFLAIFAIPYCLAQLGTGFQADSLWFFPITILIFGAALRWGCAAGLVTAVLLTFVAWWFCEDFGWFPIFEALLGGASLSYVGAYWPWDNRGGGEGRLAWQSSVVGTHPMLWHNGMVGGSASFLGIIPELETGVIVLTNTAKPVDAVGINILSELVKLKENEHGEQESQRVCASLRQWPASIYKRFITYVEQML